MSISIRLVRRSTRLVGFLTLVSLVAVCGGRAGAGEGDDPSGVWTSLRRALVGPAGGRQTLQADRYDAWSVDVDRLRDVLAAAPREDLSAPAGTAGIVLPLPAPGGGLERFLVVESPVMEPGLAEQFPDIRTYAGVGVDDPAASMRLSVTMHGVTAIVLSPRGTSFVEPIWFGDARTTACYLAKDATQVPGGFACHTPHGSGAAHLRLPGGPAAVTSGSTLRTYRLAVAATGEYTASQGGTVPGAMASITATVNAVNAIYDRDVAIRFNLVATNANVVFTNAATDPFPSGTTLANLNAESQAALDAAPPVGIGSANYDIGHTFTAVGFSGNAGAIGSICNNATKGSGWSAAATPTGGNFTFLVSHEMGHQSGGRHTFKGSGCNPGSYDPPSAVEPGSGSTIMSYSSICGADNLLGSAVGDLYFHVDSITRIVAYTTGGGNACATSGATGNAIPTVNAGPDFTIPQLTPFVLSATGNDGDGDPLTYTFEETDPAGGPSASAVTPDDGAIPLIRSFPPSSATTRTVPLLADLVAGNLWPGTIGEQLPSSNRTLQFTVTVRDNRPNGGGVNTDDVVLTVTTAAGPFVVTSPNGGESWPEGSAQTVTWNVAGTTAAPVSVANVRILLSTDGGLTYPDVLVASTPNDGSESVTLPACALTTTARIRVEAIGNIFFDISDADFTISDISPPTVTVNVTRGVLWPATRGLLDVGLTHSAVDNCPGAVTFQDLRVHSDEGNGAAPYAPDATLSGSTLRLRAERLIPGDGRVYLVVPRYQDASGNAGVGVVSAVVPGNLTVAHLTALLLDASTKRAACEAGGGAAPAGTSQIFP